MRNPERLLPEWKMAEQQAHFLFWDEGITRQNKPILFIERKGSEVVGAVAGAVVNGVFSFDVVVRQKHQGRGIGKQLIKAVDDYYESIKDEYPFPKFRAQVHVIHPAVEHILQKLGYHFTHQSHYGSIMEKY